LGTLFSLITGYKANDYPIVIRIIIWMMNLLLSWVISTSIMKIFLREKTSFFNYKHLFVSYVISLLFVWFCGFNDGDYSYVSAAIVLLAIVGAIRGIKFIKRVRGRPKKKKVIENKDRIKN
jgi:hypothetical protein